MNIQEIVAILTNSGIEPNEANVEVKMLIEHYCNYGIKDIIMGRPLDYEKLKIVKEKAQLRARTKLPIQYIIGATYFMNNLYTVTPDVLIPRDETEIVVRHALKIIDDNNLKTILDIGSGSGCIACSIAQNTNCKVLSCDISEKALNIAKQNAKKLNIQNIEFIHSDLFQNISKEQRFDLIISNPPYIPKGTDLQKEVTFEPKTALFTNDEDGTEFYKKIIEQGKMHLNKNGYIVFELGINQSSIVEEYFKQHNYSNIIIEKDLANIDRVISAKI